MQLDSQTVTVDLIKSAAGQGPNTSSTRAAVQSGDSMAVSHVRAETNVQFISKAKGIQFHAHTIDYDPATQRLIARGSPEEPAYFEDQQGMSTGGFDELEFDTVKQEIVTVKGGRGEVVK